jgi:Branched-chain amino acid ABC-type transport system, permease components
MQLLINGLALGSVYALISVGFALIFNVLKFSNFSHGGVMVICAYTGYLITTNFKTNLFVTLLLSAIVGGLLAMGIELIGFRRLRKSNKEVVLYFVSTVTISTLLGNLMTIFFSSTFYSYPKFFNDPYFKFLGVNVAKTDAMMLVISIAAILGLLFIVYRTRLGISIRAISMDTKTTSLMGINTTLIISATFFVAGVFGGLSGVFLGINYILSPQLGNLVVKGYIASVLGGLGDISGAVIGAVLLGLIESMLISVDFIGAGLAPAVIFLILMLFMFLRPQGITGKSVIDKA